ncbi:MAG: protein kinase [Gemmataceae bacterium]
MSSCPTPSQLEDLLADRLRESAAAVEEHVETCGACQAELERLAAAAAPSQAILSETSLGLDRKPGGMRDLLLRLQQAPPEGNVTTILAGPPGDGPAAFPALPGYELEAEVGRGGMGVVYRARQLGLQRVVAIKMLLHAGQASPEALARFRVEAEAVARLEHAAIVQIHEIGEQDGRPFLALEFVGGGNLAQRLQGVPQRGADAAEMVETLARAIDRVHAGGIVHRDLKPANILLTVDGRPKVSDFGLAKLTTGGSDQTRSGAILGSPSYMAPEQASGKSGDAGPAVDIYALGAILYEMLTGRPPFRGETVTETLRQITTQEPVAPRRLQPSVARDLDTICLKCLEKDPRRRYPTALALAEDLRRFRANEPIVARPAGVPRRVWKWARRRPATATFLGAAVVAAVALLVVGLWYQAELEDALARITKEKEIAQTAQTAAERRRLEAVARRDEALRSNYLYSIPLAHRAWDAGKVVRMGELLDKVRPLEADDKDLRHFEWHYLNRLRYASRLILTGHAGAVTAVAYSPDQRRLASAGVDGTVRLWNGHTGAEERLLKGHAKKVTALAFTSDGALLASAGSDGSILLWAGEAAEPIRLTGHKGWVYGLAFHPDGKRLASAAADGAVRLWNCADRKEITRFGGREGRVTSIAFSRDGQWLAAGGDDYRIELRNVTSGKIEGVGVGHVGWIYGLAFHPEGKILASASYDDSIRIWRLDKMVETQKFVGNRDSVRGLVFNADGSRLASAGFDQSVRVWDAASGTVLLRLKGHLGHVNSVSFHPDGRSLASAGDDGTIRVWDLDQKQDFLAARGHSGAVTAVAFHPEGRLVASAAADGTVRLWHAATGKEAHVFKGHKGRVTAVAFDPKGRFLVSGGSDRTVRLWDLVTKKGQVLAGHAERVTGVGVSPDGARIVSSSFDGTLKIWRVADGVEERSIDAHSQRAEAIVLGGDGKTLISGGSDKLVKVWDAATGKERMPLKGHVGWVFAVALSKDGQWIASGGQDGKIKVWSAADGALKYTLEGHAARVAALVFSPDGRRLASGSFDKSIKLWDLDIGQELLALHNGANVYGLAFSPDGHHLASAGYDETVRIWDATPVGAAPPLRAAAEKGDAP